MGTHRPGAGLDLGGRSATISAVRSLRFVINALSGGQQGQWLRRQLAHRFPPASLGDLPGADLGALAREAAAAGAAVVACGGDGTAAAVIEAGWQPSGPVSAPVGIIPLGTGNDLARILGWGSCTPDASGLDGLLVRLQNARTSAHDRWVVEGPDGRRAWFNYLSVGADARIARRFHRLRGHHPWLFRGGPLANKALYGAVALAEVHLPLGDGVAVAGLELPRWTRALVFANIPSYAGGTVLGQGISPVDGHIDVFALGPGSALGLAAAGLRRPERLGAHARLEIEFRRPQVVQVDGEPLLAPAGTYRLFREGMVRVLSAW